MRILINRNDNIGDVILTLPMAYQLKQHFPACQVFFLARPYVRAVLDCCPDVDGFIDSDALLAKPKHDAARELQAQHFDVFINAIADKACAQLAKLANIPLRIGTSHRWYHWLYCNKRINFSRAQSKLHEAQLNLKLLAGLGISWAGDLPKPLPRLHASQPLTKKVAALLDPQRINLVLHPGSNGNGREWPEAYFLELMNTLPSAQFNLFLSGSPQEKTRFAKGLLAACPAHCHNLMGELSLAEFIVFLQHADALLAAGTGPLHLAAALGIYTLGLFPNHHRIGPARWGPLGKQAHALCPEQVCACQSQGKPCQCMQTLTPTRVAKQLQQLTKVCVAHED